jgi:serine/threonine protein kinase/tetratricopeptide (TPR) repeat protein
VNELVLRCREEPARPVEEVCAGCPELLPEVRQQLVRLASMDRIFGGGTGKAGVDTGVVTVLRGRTGPFEEVVAACEAFVLAGEGGPTPSLDGFLARVPTDAQPTLLRNLLAIEIDRRRARGERPLADEYLDRLPQLAQPIREAFLELSLSTPTRLGPRPQLAGPVPAATRLGGYRLLGKLGQGGMGVVYEAVHLQRGHRVALKTLPTLDGAALHRFKREFRALADVNHPNLIGLHTLEADGGQWFFTMDLVKGTTFLKYVRPGGILDEPRLRAALAQLRAAVMALHGLHIIHRDLKPSNVLVTHGGQVIVLDFGLVLELDSATHNGGAEHLAGTPTYMAPEQAAGEEIILASDWYAVGVMLYEALAGRLPFSGSMFQVLQDKQCFEPPPLPDEETIPADLAGLCLHLLAREPRRRPDAFEIIKVLGAGTQATAAVIAHSGQRLVGRAQHLAALHEAYRTLQRQREPLTLFLSGRSGEGKTTLAEYFLASLRQERQTVVMSGRCYDRESVPFKALDTLIDALAGYLRSLPGEDASLLLPDDFGTLVHVFPVLGHVEAVARAADTRLVTLDEQVRQRAFLALRLLLSHLSRRCLIVWFIDDLQWGDADSAEALFEVLRPPEAPAVLFLGSYRSDETAGSAFLQMWQQLQRRHGVQFADREVKLAPLTVEEGIELVIGLLVGQDSEAIRRRAAEFTRETGGNPFLLTELVGCFDPETDSFEPVPLHEVLARKLGRLPAEAAHLLDVVAVSGQGLSLEEASRTAGHALPPVATLTRMRNERLVRLIGPEESPLVDTYHDRVRETVLGSMDEGRCRTLHRRLGEVIEQAVGGVSDTEVAALAGAERKGEAGKAVPRAYDLAYHFDAAGERRKAWVYALLAAEQARRQYALGVAVEQYAVARRNAAEATDAVRHRIAVGCGEALMLLGRYDEATAQLDVAAPLTDDPVTKATVEAYQGEIALKLGRAGQSAVLCARALRRLEHRVPQSRLGWAWGLVQESLIHGWHRLFPKRLHAEAPSPRGDLASWLFARLAYAYIVSNTPKSLWALYAGMNHGERLPPSPALAFLYGGYGCLLGICQRLPHGLTYLNRSLEVRRQFNDRWGIAQTLMIHGFALYANGRYRESIAKLDEAMDLYHLTGDQWENNAARLHWVLCQDKLGNPAAVLHAAQTVFARDVPHGDANSGHCTVFGWSLGALGNLPFEELKSCFHPLPDNILLTSLLLMGEGHWHWFHSRTPEALRAFESAYQLVKRNCAINHLTVATLPWLVTALRRHAEFLESRGGRQAQPLRRRAFRMAKWAARLSRWFPPHRPHALRELSHAYAAGGSLRKALQSAEQSCAVAEGQSAKYEYAESLLLRGRLGHRLGLPGAAEQIRAAAAALAARDEAIRVALSRSPAS